MHGIKSAISAIAVHPTMPYLAIAGADGFIILWNYIKKGDPISNYENFQKDKSEKQNPDFKFFTCMEFTPDGSEILVAQYSGEIKVMDSETVTFKKLNTPLKVSENNHKAYATQLVVTHDGKYFACCDNDCSVLLFKKDHFNGDPNQEITWFFNGKMKSHEIAVTQIAFGEGIDDQGQPMHRLFSIGKDRRLFEYDVYNSVGHDKLIVLRHFTIEQEALPTSCIWYPKKDSKEGLLLTANNEYKMKVWNPSAQSSRATCLGPTYGGELSKMKQLKLPGLDDKYIAYQTANKVMGLIKMPIDGNPNKTMGLIAHPGKIADFCVSQNENYLFTCGGADLSVKMWAIDVQPIENAIALGQQGDEMDPFIELIEGGREGQNYQDMKDFFYYSMIRSKNENTTKSRKLDNKVPLSELPNLMRAMGYYPTEQEVQNMKDEVKFSIFSDEGKATTSVELDQFIKLFVNHRPVYGIGKNNIEEAFRILSQGRDGSANELTLNRGKSIYPGLTVYLMQMIFATISRTKARS